MTSKESALDKIMFFMRILFIMITPPFYSFDRLEEYCRYRKHKDPESYLPRWFLAVMYKDNNKYEESRSEYQGIARLGLMTEKDAVDFGEVLFLLNDYKGVIDALEPVIGKRHKNVDANYYLGVSYMKVDEYEKAIGYLEKAVMKERQGYENYWHLGWCYSRVGKYEEAKCSYIKALSMKPDNVELKENIISVCISIAKQWIDRDLNKTESVIREALQFDPDNTFAVKMLTDVQHLRNLRNRIEETRRNRPVDS